ncbi:MAG: cupin domain-containing protein [Candidatus Acidiferrum sp.]
MRDLDRRAFVGAALAAFPLAVLGRTGKSAADAAGVKAALVLHGEDREGLHHHIGVSSTDYKVTTRDSSGALFIFEHTHHTKKGGPPRHLHHNEDEWFYVIEGDYIVEAGAERFQLGPGDSILGPREVPHVWAFVGDTPGKLLITFAPANKMEAFFRDNAKQMSGGKYANEAEMYQAYGMELLGPPLSLG